AVDCSNGRRCTRKEYLRPRRSNAGLGEHMGFQAVIAATRVGQAILDAMEEQGFDLRSLSLRLDITYEHLRRITRGEGVPSNFVLAQISDTLNLDFKRLHELAFADRVRRRYGIDRANQQTGVPLTVLPLLRVWGYLDALEQHAVIALAETFAKARISRERGLGS
ncbi:MAG TPA: helix-turn-helix transcriptional regulator, partial [Bryobacteraceae bacterium]|nr:helix-turn-helix transcriptional regulator [Bryobacteraceae bacterium]